MQVAEQLPVARAPFVEALLQVSHHEDRPVLGRLDDLVDVTGEHCELRRARVLEFVEEPVLDAAVQAVLDLLLLERVGLGQQRDVVAEAQQAASAVGLIVDLLVRAEAAVEGLGLLQAGRHQLVDGAEEQVADGIRGRRIDVDGFMMEDGRRPAGLDFEDVREVVDQSVGDAVGRASGPGGFGQVLEVRRPFGRFGSELTLGVSGDDGPFLGGIDLGGVTRPAGLCARPDEGFVTPEARVIAGDHQLMVILGHLRHGFERVGHFHAVVIVLEAGQHRGGRRTVQTFDDGLEGFESEAGDLLIRDGGGAAGVQADFEGEVVDQLREEAVERTHRQAVRRQERLPEHFPELLLVELGGVELQPLAEAQSAFLVLGCFAEFRDDPHDEFRRGGAGERQRGDFLVLHAEGQQFHDTVRELERLTCAGRSQDGGVTHDAH